MDSYSRGINKTLVRLFEMIKNDTHNPKKIKVLLGDGYDPTSEIEHPTNLLKKNGTISQNSPVKITI